MKVDADILRDALDYYPDIGIFIWKIKPNRRIRIGSVAGTECHGRWQIRINKITYRAHRLAWLYMYREWPECEIDHINGNPLDNRIVNLRDVSVQMNRQNFHGPNSRNKLGVLGVGKAQNQQHGYRARINHTHLGTFKTIDEAHQAYLAAKRELHEGCTI